MVKRRASRVQDLGDGHFPKAKLQLMAAAWIGLACAAIATGYGDWRAATQDARDETVLTAHNERAASPI